MDFSGDIWGDNARFSCNDRFEVGLIKDRVAQLLGKKTAMIAGSPGPLATRNIAMAKTVFDDFGLVTNREAVSRELLQDQAFRLDHVVDLACPAFLFEPGIDSEENLVEPLELSSNDRNVGFVLCGWNFETGPFDKWPRQDSDYAVFAELIENIVNQFDVNVCLMSHSNGFTLPAPPFQLKHGRDYPICKQLERVVKDRGNIGDKVTCVDRVLSAWETKSFIGKFDMFISGRVHAAVAALSQMVPTVIIDYGHEPKAHKLMGSERSRGFHVLLQTLAISMI